MYIINGSQIRAARGLLNWTQDDLAEKSQVGRGTIQLIENNSPVRISRIIKLHDTLENHGIEFMQSYGVRLRAKDFKDFTGSESCDQFIDHVAKTLKERGGEFICIIREQDMLARVSGTQRRSNIERLEQLQKITNVKCLLTEAVKPSFDAPSFDMRQLPEDTSGMPASVFAFGNQWVMGYADDSDACLTFIVIQQMKFVQAFHQYFYPRWHKAEPVRLSSNKKHFHS